MLSVAELQSILDEVTYKPGWEIRVRGTDHEGAQIVMVVHEMPDSTQPGKTLDLGIVSYLPPMQDEQALLNWLAWRIERIENHEVREWLKLRGETVFDPHADPTGV